MTDDYLTVLKGDREFTREYYRRSIVKTEQQKFLEKLLTERRELNVTSAADLGCGAGTLSYHLSKLCEKADFTLLDYNDDALAESKRLNGDSPRYKHVRGSLHDLPWRDASFDAVFCAQTISWIDMPDRALREMMRSVKKGGVVYCSGLFNLNHDVDLRTEVTDHTKQSAEHRIPLLYQTYSRRTIETWLGSEASNVEFIPFNPEIDFLYEGRGIGTYTIPTPLMRLQLSAGLLLNWAFLIATR